MNKARRKEIQKAIEKIEDLVQQIRDDEEDAFNSMPEGLQESENGLTRNGISLGCIFYSFLLQSNKRPG